MKISYNWLLQYLDQPVEINTLCEALTEIGLEVDGTEPLGQSAEKLAGLVVGEVLSCEQHPNADRLRCTIVTTDGNNRLPIVCGAPNVAAGQKVVVAPVGTTLYPVAGEAFTIKKAKIRGEASEGMLCAEDEIGIGQSHAGIIVLPVDAVVGTSIASIFGSTADVQIEIGLTPNRTDAISHYGVARDVAAHLQIGRKFPLLHEPSHTAIQHAINIQIDAPAACSRFAGICLSGVKLGPSPDWLQERLKSIGSKPINNVVDVTNFVMFELGQPLHAYDLRKIKGNRIIVRQAGEGEHITLLDKKEYTLQSANLLVCNAEEAMGVAGVMGGLNDSIAADTTDIFIESAHFDAATIRKSSRLLGIKSDASYRFERGVDPDMVLPALQRAVNLILEVAGGAVSSPLSDVACTVAVPKRMHLLYGNFDRIIGKKIKREEIRDILRRLDFVLEYEHAEGVQVVAPNYRVDVTREIDVIEEVLRIHGLNKIPLGAAVHYHTAYPKRTNKNEWQQRIANQLASNGYHECMSLSFISQSELALEPAFVGREIRVLNPVNEQVPVLRPSLLFSGLQNISYNLNRRQLNLHLFEFGKVYLRTNRARTEQEQLALFVTGNQSGESWYESGRKSDFYHLHAEIRRILERMGLADVVQASAGSHPCLTDQLQYNLNGKAVIYLGKVKQSITRHYDIKQEVWYATLEWAALMRETDKPTRFKELPKFPAMRRDLALVIGSDVAYVQLENIAKETAGGLLKEVNLFDVYEGDKMGAGKRSYALSFVFLDEEKTLTDEQADKVMQKLMHNFEKSLGATVRQ